MNSCDKQFSSKWEKDVSYFLDNIWTQTCSHRVQEDILLTYLIDATVKVSPRWCSFLPCAYLFQNFFPDKRSKTQLCCGNDISYLNKASSVGMEIKSWSSDTKVRNKFKLDRKTWQIIFQEIDLVELEKIFVKLKKQDHHAEITKTDQNLKETKCTLSMNISKYNSTVFFQDVIMFFIFHAKCVVNRLNGLTGYPTSNTYGQMFPFISFIISNEEVGKITELYETGRKENLHYFFFKHIINLCKGQQLPIDSVINQLNNRLIPLKCFTRNNLHKQKLQDLHLHCYETCLVSSGLLPITKVQNKPIGIRKLRTSISHKKKSSSFLAAKKIKEKYLAVPFRRNTCLTERKEREKINMDIGQVCRRELLSLGYSYMFKYFNPQYDDLEVADRFLAKSLKLCS